MGGVNGLSLMGGSIHVPEILWSGCDTVIVLPMFVLETYRSIEARDVLLALKQLVRDPTWSAAGVYCYWNPESHEILYLGLASSLPARFRAHNGLGSAGSLGNKLQEITDYFRSHDELGLTVGVQSAAAGEIGRGLAADSEGQLLKDYRRRYGSFPSWNKIGGSKEGAALSRTETSNTFELLSGAVDSLLVARRSLRRLVDDADALWNESVLHTARIDAQIFAGLGDQKISDADMLSWLQSPPPFLAEEAPRFRRLLDSGYLRLRPLEDAL